MTTTPNAWANALALHQAGQLAQAEQFYRQVLHDDPEHDGALHSLGVLAWQTGNPQAAVEYLVRALEEGVKLALGSRVIERRARLRVIGSGLRHALHG